MTSSNVSRAVETVERRAEDLRLLYSGGAQPNYSDILRDERGEPANDALCVMLPRETYLMAGDPNRPVYTRDGALGVRDGVLTAGDGTPVLGYRGDDRSGIPQTLAIDKNDAAFGRVQDLRIEPDGVFGYARTVIDPKTLQPAVERVVIGRLALARFPAGSHPDRVDATHVRAPLGVVPFVGTPNDGNFASLMPQRRAIGRLDPDAAIERLQDAYVMLRALGAVERTRSGMIRGALDLVK